MKFFNRCRNEIGDLSLVDRMRMTVGRPVKNFFDSLLKNPSFEDFPSNDFFKVLRISNFQKKVGEVSEPLDNFLSDYDISCGYFSRVTTDDFFLPVHILVPRLSDHIRDAISFSPVMKLLENIYYLEARKFGPPTFGPQLITQ